MLLIKYRFWDKGISPREFNKIKMKDIQDIMDIDNAIEGKKSRELAIQEAMHKLKR